MKDVSGALKINPLKYKDRAVKSIPKRVTNVSEHLTSPLSLEDFTQMVMDHIVETHVGCKLYTFTSVDLAAIEKIKKEKYDLWEWNFGHSPKYNFQQGVRTEGGTLEMNLEVVKGVIKNAKIFGDFFGKNNVEDIEKALVGQKHDPTDIGRTLDQFDIEDYFHLMQKKDILSALF